MLPGVPARRRRQGRGGAAAGSGARLLAHRLPFKRVPVSSGGREGRGAETSPKARGRAAGDGGPGQALAAGLGRAPHLFPGAAARDAVPAGWSRCVPPWAQTWEHLHVLTMARSVPTFPVLRTGLGALLGSQSPW